MYLPPASLLGSRSTERFCFCCKRKGRSVRLRCGVEHTAGPSRGGQNDAPRRARGTRRIAAVGGLGCAASGFRRRCVRSQAGTDHCNLDHPRPTQISSAAPRSARERGCSQPRRGCSPRQTSLKTSVIAKGIQLSRTNLTCAAVSVIAAQRLS